MTVPKQTILYLVLGFSLMANIWLTRELYLNDSVTAPKNNATSSIVSNPPPGVLAPLSRSKIDAVAPKPGSSTVLATAPAPAKLRRDVDMQEYLRDPKIRARLLAQIVASKKDQNPDLGAKLGLDDTAIERLLTINAELAWSLAGQPGVDMRTLLKEKVSDEFGSSVAQKYEDYQTTELGNQRLATILPAFAEADIPLTKDQHQQLATLYGKDYGDMSTSIMQVLGASDPAASKLQMLDAMQRGIEHMQTVNQQILQSAHSILTSGQLELLKQTQAQELNNRQTSLEAMRNFDAATLKQDD